MKASAENLLETMFENKTYYEIPVYQRNYDWSEEECNTLFEDIIYAHEKNEKHFFGTVVQVGKKEDMLEGIRYNNILVDGQQRMTTVYILLKVLYDMTTDLILKERLENYIFNSSNSHEYSESTQYKLKLKQVKSDEKAFLNLMQSKTSDPRDRIDSNIYKNYYYLKNKVKEYLDTYESNQLDDVLDGLKKLEIVLITLEEAKGDKPQEVFESINSKGIDLSLSDLVRNYLLMVEDNAERYFKEYWSPMEDELGKENVKSFITTYLAFKVPEFKEKKAYNCFKKYVEDHKNELNNENILIDLKKYSKYYKAFISDDNQYDKKIKYYLSFFRTLKQTTIYVFLLKVFDDFENKMIDEETLEKILLLFINYTIRRSIAKVPSNSLNKFYRGLYSRCFKENSENLSYFDRICEVIHEVSFQDAMPTDENIKSHLEIDNFYSSKVLCKVSLSIIENGLKYSSEKVNIDDKITIEHVLPQNSKAPEWRKDLGDKFDYVYNTFLNNIGNLTLTGYNSELSDDGFSKKKKMLEDNSKFYKLNESIISEEKWNEEAIVRRRDNVISLLLEKLKLPQIFYTPSGRVNHDGHFLSEPVDYTHSTPYIFELEDVEYNISPQTFAELFKKICLLLYDRMYSKDFPFFSKEKFSGKNINSEKLDGQEVYVKTNYSANDTIKNIRKIFDEVDDLSYDDLILYVDFSREANN